MHPIFLHYSDFLKCFVSFFVFQLDHISFECSIIFFFIFTDFFSSIQFILDALLPYIVREKKQFV